MGAAVRVGSSSTCASERSRLGWTGLWFHEDVLSLDPNGCRVLSGTWGNVRGNVDILLAMFCH